MAITRRRLGAVVLLLLLLQNQVLAQEGILHVSRDKTQESTKDYCVLYNPSWTSLPESLDNVTLYNLENFTSITLCKPTDVPALGFQGGAVMVTNGTCSVLEKARLAQRNGANMLLLVSKYGIITPTDNKTLFQDVKIPVAAIRFGDVMDMQKTLGDSVMVTLYSPAVKMFDYSMLVIFLIAVFTVALGGYWSGVGELDDMRPAANGAEGEARKKDDNVTFTPLTVVAFVAVCCAMILLLYFFYKWLAPLVTTTQVKPSGNHEEEPDTEETSIEKRQATVSRRIIRPSRLQSTESANSFTLIGEASDGGTMENLSRRLKVTGDLFDIMSGQTDVDHPLCEECTDTLLDQLDSQLTVTENECQNYK